MTGVRVLVGTRKGAFVLTSERAGVGRQRPPLRRLGDLPPQGIARRSGPAVRLAVQRLVRPGHPALRRRRPDLGAGRQQVRLRRHARHAPVVRRDAASLGVQAGLAPRAVAGRPGHRLRRGRGRRAVPVGRRREDLAGTPGLRAHGRARPGSRAPAGCACTRSCSTRSARDGCSPRSRPRACSAATTPAQPGGRSTAGCSPRASRTRTPRSATACTASRCTRAARDVLFMQKHWDVMRSDDGGDSWREVSGNLPTDFGFPIDVHAHEPETIYVVPITSDSEHYPPEGKLRVYRSRTGGNEWEPLTNGLPQEHCYVNVLRDAMAVDSLDACGVYFGTTGGQVYGSADAGDTWAPIVRDLPARAVRRGADAAMIRVVLPAHLRTLARVDGEVELDVTARSPSVGPGRAGGSLPGAPRHDPRPAGARGGRSSGSSRASRTCPTSRPTPAARAGRHGRGAVPDRGGDGGRLVLHYDGSCRGRAGPGA